MHHILVIATIPTLIIICTAQNSGRSCNTPEGRNGRCVLLSECSDLLELLQPPVTPSNLRRLQKSTCDASGAEPKVCCPSKQSPQQSVTQPTTPRPRPTPESDILKKILNNPNLHLLPNSEACGKMGNSADSDRIAGGTDAGLGTYPWMILIGFSSGSGKAPVFACGGTLINSRYILTASHCVSELPPGYTPVVIRVGEYNMSSELDCEKTICAAHYQDIAIEETIPHKDYDLTSKKENDIALIRLKTNVAFNPFVSPICLPHGEKLQKTESSKAMVAGWGRTQADNPDMSPVLQHVSVPFQSMETCNKNYKESLGHNVEEGRFCAGGVKGKDSCKGDSGGPLMVLLRAKNVNWDLRVFQFGVVSLGPVECDNSNYPALYTKVSHYVPWILDNLRP